MRKVLTPCLLLIVFSVSVRSQGETAQKPEIKVSSVSEGIKVRCPDGHRLYKGTDNVTDNVIKYKDHNSGEYSCEKDGSSIMIFVKFRTCDNCVELDATSLSGMIVGDVVATLVIGVSVYLIAKHAQIGTTVSPKKGSDRQHLVSNDMDNDAYQSLRHKNGQRDVYDRLRK